MAPRLTLSGGTSNLRFPTAFGASMMSSGRPGSRLPPPHPQSSAISRYRRARGRTSPRSPPRSAPHEAQFAENFSCTLRPKNVHAQWTDLREYADDGAQQRIHIRKLPPQHLRFLDSFDCGRIMRTCFWLACPQFHPGSVPPYCSTATIAPAIAYHLG